MQTADADLAARRIHTMNSVADALVANGPTPQSLAAFLYAMDGERYVHEPAIASPAQQRYERVATLFNIARIDRIFAALHQDAILEGAPYEVHSYSRESFDEFMRHRSYGGDFSAATYDVSDDGRDSYLGQIIVPVRSIIDFDRLTREQVESAPVHPANFVALKVTRSKDEREAIVASEASVAFGVDIAEWCSQHHVSIYGAELLKVSAAQDRLLED